MEQTKETTTQTTEKAAVWSVRLSENDKIRLNNLLTLMHGTDNREKLMSIVSKAEAEATKEETGSQFVKQMEQYADAIVKAAIAQAAAAGTAESRIYAEYDKTLADKTAENADLLEVIKDLKSQVTTLKETIKTQKEQISDAADRVEKQKEEIYCLKNDLETAQRNAEAVAEIQKEYSQRAKSAEAAKAAAEKAAADALAAQQAAEKENDRLKLAAAGVDATNKAQAEQIADLKAQLAAAQAQSAQLVTALATQAQQQQQHVKKSPAKAKAEAQHDENGEFEHTLEQQGQQKLIKD